MRMIGCIVCARSRPGDFAGVGKAEGGYFFYLRKGQNDPDDLVYQLAAGACCVATDDNPVFIPAIYNRSVPAKIGIP
jgi:hypothetical protein